MILIATPAPDTLLSSTLDQLRLPGTHPVFLRRDGHTAHLLMPRQDTPVATLTISADRRTVQATTPTGTLTLSELHFNRAANTFDPASTDDLHALNSQIDALNHTADHLIRDLISDYARAEEFTVTEFFPDAQENMIDALLFNPSYPTPDAPQYVGVNLIRLEDRYRLTSGSTNIADYLHDGQTWTWTGAATPAPDQPTADQPAPAPHVPEPRPTESHAPAPPSEHVSPEHPTDPPSPAPQPGGRQLFTPNPIPTPRTNS